MSHIIRLAVLLAATLAIPAGVVSAAEAGQMEASFILNLFRYVTWPTSPIDTATVCFLQTSKGPSQVQSRLEWGLARHQGWAQLDDRTVVVKVLPDISMLADKDNAGCQILYLDARTASEVWPFPFPLPGTLLTVSNQRDFLKRGGMVQFIWDSGDTYRIAISPANVRNSGVVVSVELEVLADRVDDERYRHR
jgi:hypothetical protein